MARVILALICAVFAFVLAANFSPGLIKALLPHDESSDAADAQKSATAQADHAAKNKSTAAKPTNKQLPAAPVTAEVSPNPETTPVAVPEKRSTRPVFTVSTDNTALYSANAPGGVVISHLQKGAVVEPQFTLNSAGQEWTFVSVGDPKVTGFLRSDTVARQPTSR
jgi:hypothetical protein